MYVRELATTIHTWLLALSTQSRRFLALHNHLFFIANGDFSVIQHGALAMICRVVQGTKREDNEVILAVTALHHHVGKKGPNKLGRYL